VAWLLGVVLLSTAAVSAATEQPWQWDGVPKVVAFGDVHGAHDRLVDLLTQAGIIDTEQAWVGGEAHLVSIGDLLDRGPDSRKVLDLLMRLEGEARRAGGRVHLVLGNHEVMNLIGDLRYVSNEEYRAFAADETPSDREQAWNRFRRRHESAEGPEDLRAKFDEAYPPGFFGLLAAFDPDGNYGSWLLQRNVLIRIDGTAFVHGGLSRVAGQIDGAELNRWAMIQLREYLALVDRLEELGVLAPETGYAERAALVRQALGALNGPAVSAASRSSGNEIRELGQRFLELSDRALVFQNEGPLWYRETADGAATTEQAVLDRALAALGAARVAIGHTPTADGRIAVRLGGRALMIDTGMLEQAYEGNASALIQQGRRISAFYPAEAATAELQVATGIPRPTDVPTTSPTDAELEEFLLTATPVQAERLSGSDQGLFRITLEKDGVQRRAAFNTTDTSASDTAAYRLDRLLGLDMVPVTVGRTVQEREGALRSWVELALTDDERRELGLGRQHQPAIDVQLQQMQSFDALIYNGDRHAGSILLTPADWRVHLIDHTGAFLTKTSRPAALRKLELSPTPELAAAIAKLDEGELHLALDGLLKPSQINSILKRREKIVADWTKAGLLREIAAPAGR
jgi:hypothetical protein